MSTHEAVDSLDPMQAMVPVRGKAELLKLKKSGKNAKSMETFKEEMIE